MQTIKCAIVDDEPLALDLIESYIKKTPFLELAARCSNAFQAIETLKDQKIELLFLDIQMPGLTGLELSKTLTSEPRIIFTTAYGEYALEGFRANALDYLLKPFDYTEFLKAANKAHDWFSLKSTSLEPSKPESIMVKSDSKLNRILISNIIYIESMGDYIKIYCGDNQQPIITQTTMKSIEEKLPASIFFRVHRSYIVNINHIQTIERNRIVFGKTYIPISESIKGSFFKLLSDENL
ncbi:LytR/AlgR family response regulator transcription factor [Alkaliflexus imshenetskii]|uniref:LytR/AlgR family response regulator transcription factor n=1 Tax=Alkaliflexus imshenetskii TaxID=286730 RepID=UPI00047929C2|nr:LytTR family DNA-binding domain-containing protein [Alkaliflexus imshenetskii]